MIYWGVLLERCMYDQAVKAVMRVAYRAGKMGFPQIHVPHMATEWAREEFTRGFLEISKDPEDTLVMLDADHEHPNDIVERLGSTEYGVVAAMAFCRGAEPRPAFFMYEEEEKEWYSIRDIPKNEIIPVDVVGTGAIAIKRWVFYKIAHELPGHPPYWRKMYDVARGGEDWYFSKQCKKAGIQCYVNTGVEIPHYQLGTVTEKDWENYAREHLHAAD